MWRVEVWFEVGGESEGLGGGVCGGGEHGVEGEGRGMEWSGVER